MQIQTIAKASLIIFLYYVVYALFLGFSHPIPAPGDSFAYHIPISQMILNGTFVHPAHVKLPQWYYPGSSEAINSLFILLHIPLTVSNLFASLVLFICLWKLGQVFDLDYYYSLLFALTFCTLNVIVRWFNAVSIDVWVAVFFCLAIILLEKPQKSWKYAAKLGFVLGMLIGSKYTAVSFLIVLFFFYIKSFGVLLKPRNILAFIIPFSILGLFWYIRNLLLMGNPFYPLAFFGLKSVDVFGNMSVESVGVHHPIDMFNSLFAEYKLWFLVLLLPLFIIVYKYIRKKQMLNKSEKLIWIGFINSLLFTQFPTSNHPWIMVSSFRYSYPVFIPLMLGAFIIAKKYRFESFLGYFAIGNMIMVTSFVYLPKLVLFYIPLAFVTFYFLEKYKPSSSSKK